MENRKRIIELLTAVRYTTNDIEKVADEICSLFSVVGQSEQLFCEEPESATYRELYFNECDVCGRPINKAK